MLAEGGARGVAIGKIEGGCLAQGAAESVGCAGIDGCAV